MVEERIKSWDGYKLEKAAVAVDLPLVLARLDRDAIVDHPVADNGYNAEGLSDELGAFWYPANLVQFEGVEVERRKVVPNIPSTGRLILAELGYDDAEIMSLASARVVVA